MSFGIPEVRAERHPPRTMGKQGIERTWEYCRVILPDGREVQGEYNSNSNEARFHFKVDGRWYSGPVFGKRDVHRGQIRTRRGLMGEESGRNDTPTVDLRRFVGMDLRRE